MDFLEIPSRQELDISFHPRVLVVEEDNAVRSMINDALEEDARVESTMSVGDAVKLLEKRKESEPFFDLLITELDFVGPRSGSEVIDEFKNKFPNSPVIVLTSKPDLAHQVFAPQELQDLKIEIWSKAEPKFVDRIANKIKDIRQFKNQLPTFQ